MSIKRLKIARNSHYRLGLKRQTKLTVIIMLILLLVICGVGRLHRLNELKDFKISFLEPKITVLAKETANLTNENDALKQKLTNKVSLGTSETTKAITRMYIHKYFSGNDAVIAEKVFTCESGLNNLSINTSNTNGTTDRGLAQINSLHKARFEKMYGVPYETGAHDFDLSMRYAKYLVDTSGWYPWVCYSIVNKAVSQ